MSHRIFRVLYLVVPLALIAAFILRPTPILGIDGESLAFSAGADPGQLTLEPCVERGDEWLCSLPDDSEGARATVVSLDVDWTGCWTAEVVESGTIDPPAQGCVTLMDHISSTG
jgi:hypothetical protein